MTATEFVTLLNDPTVKTAMLALVAGAAVANVAPETVTAAMRKELDGAGDGKTGILAEVDARVAAKITEMETALLTRAEAKLVATLGANPAIRDFGKKTEDEPIEIAIAAQLAAGAKNRGTAIMRIANDNPELYNSARAAGKV